MIVTLTLPDFGSRRILSRADVAEILRFEVLLNNALEAGWIKPVGKTGNHKKGHEIYSRKDVEAVESRILAGEIPGGK